MARYTEFELILPTLHILNERIDKTITTSELIDELRELLKPDGEDLEILDRRNDDKFSQKVRNLISHKTLEKNGYIEYEKNLLKLTAKGEEFLNDNEEDVEKFRIEIEENNEIIYTQTKLNIGKDQYSVYDLKRKRDKGLLNLNPEFQRSDKAWDYKQKSELIESILMGIPIPLFYFNQDKNGNIIVIDGKQRLSALFDFMDLKIQLRDLKILKNINNKYFNELLPIQQGVIEDYQLQTHIIKQPIEDRILKDIFERVNRGGTQLNEQEIRNAMHNGIATQFLKKLANSDSFKKATDNSIKPDRMKDQYLALRFISFYLWWKKPFDDIQYVEYKSNSPDDFLAKSMELINKLDNYKIKILEEDFIRAMENAYKIFGKTAFRLPAKNSNKKRPVNMALYESLGYLLANRKIASFHYTKIRELFNNLLTSDKEYIDSFLSIDGTVSVRFKKMDEIREKTNNFALPPLGK